MELINDFDSEHALYFCKNSAGIVFLNGTVMRESVERFIQIGTLPEGFRPNIDIVSPCVSYAGWSAYFWIQPSGRIYLTNGHMSAEYSGENIALAASFQATQ